MDTSFPYFTNIGTVLAIFGAELFVLWLVLVRWCKLGSIAWKRIDYLWLGFTALSLIGAASQARKLIGTNLLSVAEARTEAAFGLAREAADINLNSGAVCRTFVRTEYSPPEQEFNRIQNDYNRACDWFKNVAAAMPQAFGPNADEIDLSKLPPPAIDRRDLTDAFQYVLNSVERYNSELDIASKSLG
jgi:hypothetical protein